MRFEDSKEMSREHSNKKKSKNLEENGNKGQQTEREILLTDFQKRQKTERRRSKGWWHSMSRFSQLMINPFFRCSFRKTAAKIVLCVGQRLVVPPDRPREFLSDLDKKKFMLVKFEQEKPSKFYNLSSHRQLREILSFFFV